MFNVPWEIKFENGVEKSLLRESMKCVLPEKILYRKKSPYPKTHNPIYFELCVSAIKRLIKEKSVIIQFLDVNTINSIIENPSRVSSPWYGQLMNAPQILAYLIQIDFWLKEYNVDIQL